MNAKRAHREVFKVFPLLVVFIFLIGFSYVNPIHSSKSIYFPLLNHLVPVGAERNNKLVISEIMFNPIDSEPGHEWIELFNRSSDSIDLQDFKIGDSEAQGDLEGMYVFPAGSRIYPGETIVIANQSMLFSQVYGFRPNFELLNSDPEVINLVKYKKWAGGVINLNNSGDELLLLDQEDDLMDAVSWGDSIFAFNPPAPKTEDGFSLERKPANTDSNRADDWSILAEPQPGRVNLEVLTPLPQTPTATQPACDIITILISEIFYDPELSPEPDGEWMELYNFGNKEISLECVLLGDEETNGGAEGMMVFPSGGSISPGGVIVIANRASIFLDNYGMIPDYEINDTIEEIPDLKSSPIWATGKINLSNIGDELFITKKTGYLVDAVSWGDSVIAFDPSVPSVNPGHSISRQPANMDTDSAQDWVELPLPQPGMVQLNPPNPSATPSRTPMIETPSPIPPNPTATSTQTPTSTSTSTDTPQPLIKLVINEILADPDVDMGDANNDGIVDNSDDEFIEIINSSETLRDISGWAFGDVLDIRHTFPDGSILEPSCGLVLFGGGNPNGNFGNSLVQVASSGKLGLNDNMENIYLYNSQLEVVASLSYGEEAGDNQSITRDPDIVGTTPLRKHSLATDSNGSFFSPGTQINGINFSGCPE